MNPPWLPGPVGLPASTTLLAALFFGLMAGIYAMVWWRDREPGLGWIALALAMIAPWYATDVFHVRVGPSYSGPLWAIALVQVAVMCLAVGTLRYLGMVGAWRRWLLPLLLLPPLVIIALLALDVPVPRVRGNLGLGITFSCLALVALQARRREPGAGHGWVALGLSALPLATVAMVVSGVEPVLLRYLAIGPLMLFFLLLLTVSLVRRRRALEAEVARRCAAEQTLRETNEQLELRVQQRTAELQNMVAGLESFNRSVSHDLRGPLGGIAGLARLAEAARQRADAPALARMLPMIEAQARSSQELVTALLDLARVGDAPLQRTDVSLDTLAREVVQQQLGPEPPPALQVVVDALPAVSADATLLRPVLTNLVGNALKFSAGQASPRVSIGALQGAHEVTVFVRDNGPGFPPEQAERLFQPFVRLHGQRFAGHGVGLSIVRRAVERHGGRVWAEAQPGAGACFYFSLPA
ncbi:MAG: HAMP domain-containing sensor histidine kinase [Burkholderiaceae bacterium]